MQRSQQKETNALAVAMQIRSLFDPPRARAPSSYLYRLYRVLHLKDASLRAEAVHAPIVLIPCHKHGGELSLSRFASPAAPSPCLLAPKGFSLNALL